MGTTTRDGYDDLPALSEDGYPAAVCACGAECAYPTDRICDDCWRAERARRDDIATTTEAPTPSDAELIAEFERSQEARALAAGCPVMACARCGRLSAVGCGCDLVTVEVSL